MAALTLLQKHIYQRNMAELMDKLVALLLTDYLASPQVKALINYIIQAGDTADAEVFVRDLALRVPQHGDELMTIAQQLEQKGMQLGEQRGMAPGLQLGKQQEKCTVAHTMLQHGLDHDVVMKITGLSVEELAQLGN